MKISHKINFWICKFILFKLRWLTWWVVHMVPTWTGKPREMRNLFPVREKSGNFEQTGEVSEFYPKYWKNEDILPEILEKWGNFSQFLFLFFLWLFNWSAILKKIFVFVGFSLLLFNFHLSLITKKLLPWS